MNSIALIFAATLAVAYGGLIAGDIGAISRATILQGPRVVGVGGGLITRVGSPLIVPSPLIAPGILSRQIIAPGLGLGLGGSILGSNIAILPRGSGIEGQWIPDINEKLYDDGSYKGEIY